MRRSSVASMAFAFFLAACAPPAVEPSRVLPAYGGRSTELFDDAIEPRAIGLQVEATARAQSDPLLRERVQVGDATLRVVVTTITVKPEEGKSSYQIGFRVIQKLSGANPPEETFTVNVGKQSPSAGILKSFESKLVGQKFIAFVRLFARADGDHDMHFHVAPDSPEVAAAVHDATALADLQ